MFKPSASPPAAAERNATTKSPMPQIHAALEEISIYEVARVGDKIIGILHNPTEPPIWYCGAYRIRGFASGKPPTGEEVSATRL